MFTTQEIFQVSSELECSCCATLDSFMFNRFGLDWQEDSQLADLRNTLDKIMVRVEETHPNGYKMISWIDK